jgi:hypothetical protein
MNNYKYLIIGGGMTADAAVSGIQEIDSEGSIGLVSAEPDPPYDLNAKKPRAGKFLISPKAVLCHLMEK